MKKINLWLAAGVVFMALGVVYAGNQYNWGTSTGGGWNTPDDTKTTVGQPIQIGPSGGYTVTSGGAPLSLFPQTLAQLNALAPGTTGQIALCSNCLNAIAVSTGIAAGSWTTVASSTTHIN